MVGSKLKLLYTGKRAEGRPGGILPQFFSWIFLPRSTARTPGTGYNFWTSQSCFFSSNWFSGCQHPFIVTLMVTTEPVVPSAGLFSPSSKLYLSNKQYMLNKHLISLMQCLSRVHQNRASELQALLAGCTFYTLLPHSSNRDLDDKILWWWK